MAIVIRQFSLLALAWLACNLACNKGPTTTSVEAGRESADPTAARLSLDPPEARARREQLVAELVAVGDLRSERVRDAMSRTPRHLFVPDVSPHRAYGD